jgi:hypothetical protein
MKRWCGSGCVLSGSPHQGISVKPYARIRVFLTIFLFTCSFSTAGSFRACGFPWSVFPVQLASPCQQDPMPRLVKEVGTGLRIEGQSEAPLIGGFLSRGVMGRERWIRQQLLPAAPMIKRFFGVRLSHE